MLPTKFQKIHFFSAMKHETLIAENSQKVELE